MLEIIKKIGPFKTEQIWFADYPFDIKNVDRVIFRDCKNEINAPGFSKEKITTLVIDLTQELDVIWKNMSSGNCQKAIRRAERAGVKVEVNKNYKEFYNIYRAIAKAKNLSYLSFKDIKKYATLFVAELDGKIISGHGYLFDKNNARSWVVGSDRFGLDEKYVSMVANASKLVIWEAIKYFKIKGIKEFDFGGYYLGEIDKQKKSISEFKKSFGGKITTHYVYQKDYSKLYNFLFSIKQKFINK